MKYKKRNRNGVKWGLISKGDRNIRVGISGDWRRQREVDKRDIKIKGREIDKME